MVVLDEPAAAQSDSTIVDMKLRQLSNAVSKPEDAPVKKLDRADKNQQQIENWIKNIKVTLDLKQPKLRNLRNCDVQDRRIALLTHAKCQIWKS